MRVLISGGTGMIGTALVKSLLEDGHEAFVLTRRPEKTHLAKGAEALGWDGRTTQGWGERMNEVDAVVNLVGERLSRWPWTKTQMQRFWDSRVNGGKAITEAVRAASRRPKVLIQASGINYYGPHGNEPVTEAEKAGSDFLPKLCIAWEGSTAEVEGMGVRRAVTRSGIVLNSRDEILPIMMLPVKLYAGGRLGSGEQGLAWIHQEDEVRVIRFLMENESTSGPFNLTAPETLSNAEFMLKLCKVLQRPYWLPTPAFALHLALGKMATLVLDGIYPVPQRLQEAGFKFKYENAEDALKELLTSN